MGWEDIVAWALVAARACLIVAAVGFFISGLDDLLVDLGYLLRAFYRRIFVLPKYQPLSVDQLLGHPEQPIAVMVPAWDESAVIREMLQNTLQALNYANYHIFVGIYPNDPATQQEVASVAESAPNVHYVVCKREGPTSKADCLNQIYQSAKDFGDERGIDFEVFVIDDAEDIVHPLSLKVFNYLIPRKDMVQLPVLPLEAGWLELTAGHYMDEFAENHSKDMAFRESFAHSIPCAGTGCAFSRRALERLAEYQNGEVFSQTAVTEDYEVGYLLHRLGLEGIFFQKAIERNVSKKSFWTGESKPHPVMEHIATREYFPRRFSDAVRQKSRWVLGITLQAWRRMGWRWAPPVAYLLMRDRKALLTNQINMLGYLVFLVVVGIWLNNLLLADSYRFPALVETGTWLWYLIVIDAGFLLWRLFMRGFYVNKIYGWRHALLSPIRMVWGNVINFVATSRAFWQFVMGPLLGRKAIWEKTDHRFPTELELQAHRHRLGELLMDRKIITLAQLDAALERQRQNHLPLGKVLLEMGSIEEDALVQVLGTQLHVDTREIDPFGCPLEVLRTLPRHLAQKYSVFPLELKGETLLVAADDLLTRDELEELERELKRPVEVCLSGTSDVAFAIGRGYEALERRDGPEATRLGQSLLQDGLISDQVLQEALKTQRRSYMRLGEVLLREGTISPAELQKALEGYAEQSSGPLGEYLVARGWITEKQLQQALESQRSRFKRLGEVLVDMRALTMQQVQPYLKDYRL